MNEFPELRVSLENDGFPVLFAHSDENGGGFAASSNDHTVLLRLCHKRIGFLLKILNRRSLHRISSVLRPAGFFLIARIYTIFASSATS